MKAIVENMASIVIITISSTRVKAFCLIYYYNIIYTKYNIYKKDKVKRKKKVFIFFNILNLLLY